MNIKIVFVLLTFLANSGVYAGDDAVMMTDTSAKLAQIKARMRAYQADLDITSSDTDPYALSTLGSTGCDINIGNVNVDNASESPDEVVVFIDGDIIQSNNCR